VIDRFDGCIAGVGTASGLRAVVGRWVRSPFGEFADVMVELPGGHRVLLAPSAEVAEYVAGTYTFDEVRVGPVAGRTEGPRWTVTAGPLALQCTVGRRTALGHLLRVIPRPLATSTRWTAVTDVVARTLVRGVRTRGSAGGGRREHYSALDLHRLTSAAVGWDGADQGPLTAVWPPVRFGFGSTLRTPALTRVVTLVERKA
jgi:hypothetical protein